MFHAMKLVLNMAHCITKEYKVNSLEGFNRVLTILDAEKFPIKGLKAELGKYTYPVFIHTWSSKTLTIVGYSMGTVKMAMEPIVEFIEIH